MSIKKFISKLRSMTPIDKKLALLIPCCIAVIAIVFTLGFLVGRSTRPSDVAAVTEQTGSETDSAPITDSTSIQDDSEPHTDIQNPDRTMAAQSAEVRGIYIATVQNINYPSSPGIGAEELKYELDAIISACIDANLNTIYFQVRPSSDAFYKSEIYPVSEYLTGTQGSELPDGFDPLAYLTEEAHRCGIRVHAWVNPMRVTVGSASAPKHDTNELADGHPVKEHPEYAIAYADGKLYLDCGLPEVRKLIADGVAEIVNGYDVDGVIFDDYFYPYPVYDSKNVMATFNDSATYAVYGGEMSLADWRRDNVNKMVEECYNAVKSADPSCEFGIAPCGIWQNNDGTNGGSDTSGFESYVSIYCDPTAWVKGGYVDYLAPQIYWRFTTSAARYDTLVRWWNTLLEGTGVDLLISHGVYNYDTWEAPENELRCQVEFARSELAYTGSILYGYDALIRNSNGLLDEVRDVFKAENNISETVSNGLGLEISIPYSGSYVDGAGTFVIGVSDPAEPLYLDGEKVGRTKSGYFSLYLPLDSGKNTFVFSHKGEETAYIINRGTAPQTTSQTVTYPTLNSPDIAAFTPAYEWMGSGTLPVSVTAPRGSTVKATLNGQTITLSPTLYVPQQSGKYMKEVYTGTFTLSAKAGEINELGKIRFQSVYLGKTYSAESAEIRVLGSGVTVPVEVIADDTEMKLDYDSWYYDDYTAQSMGMRDNAVLLSSGMYKLRCGGMISQDKVKELEGAAIGLAEVSSAEMYTDTKATYLKFKVSENVPINCNMADDVFTVSLYNVKTAGMPTPKLAKNPLFTSVSGSVSAKKNAYNFNFKLVNIENFYGFTHYYENGYLIFEWRNPEKLPDTDKPLEGKLIILDAGHGGANPGALGPLGALDGAMNESDLNLAIVLAAKPMLEKLGAEILLIRDENCEIDVPINDRLQTLIDTDPDLVISIHQNSMPYTTDITKVRGVVGLYWADSGYMLTETVGEAISTALNKLDRSPTKQRLAMVRNPKFPATLIETCFITSVEEYERMMKPDTLDTIAQAIADGVLEYYEKQELYLN